MITLFILLAVPFSIKTGLKSDNTLPQLSQLLTLQNNQDIMTLFCNHILACVTEKMIGNDRPKNLIRDSATVSDEAFAVLVLENMWDVWIKMDPLELFSRKRDVQQQTIQQKKQ